MDVARRKGLFIKIGAAAIVLFVLLRYINSYGDTAPWNMQKSSVFTFLSFMNISKYPPSLMFCLITLGIMFLMLAFTEGWKGRASQKVSVYGRVPLFYFLLHFFLIHLIMIGVVLLQGFSPEQMEFASGTFGRPKGVESGVGLRMIYFIWIGVVALLYFPCKWFAQYKAEHKQWWLKYM